MMAEIRAAIFDGTFQAYARDFLDGYRPADEEARRRQKRKWLASRQ
jgi:queuine/archaeosine tRNA-ribosyltransferase